MVLDQSFSMTLAALGMSYDLSTALTMALVYMTAPMQMMQEFAAIDYVSVANE